MEERAGEKMKHSPEDLVGSRIMVEPATIEPSKGKLRVFKNRDREKLEGRRRCSPRVEEELAGEGGGDLAKVWIHDKRNRCG